MPKQRGNAPVSSLGAPLSVKGCHGNNEGDQGESNWDDDRSLCSGQSSQCELHRCVQRNSRTIMSSPSHLSDAQHSDAATICSNSVITGVETECDESLISAEAAMNHSPSSSRSRFHGRLVEFTATTAAIMTQQMLPPPVPTCGKPTAEGRVPSPLLHNMGPPMSRTLVLQTMDECRTRDSTSSVYSVGSIGNDVFSHHALLSDATIDSSSSTIAEISHQVSCKVVLSSSTCSRPSSVKSFGSTEDCGGSLDVETHSIETKSVHSQEETSGDTNVDVIMETDKESTVVVGGHMLSEHLLSNEPMRGLNHTSRGRSRHRGWLMHLPLMRFHHGGVYRGGGSQVSPRETHEASFGQNCSVELSSQSPLSTQQPYASSLDKWPEPGSCKRPPRYGISLEDLDSTIIVNAMEDPRRDAPDQTRRQVGKIPFRHSIQHGHQQRNRSRSRSRSRSPSPSGPSPQKMVLRG